MKATLEKKGFHESNTHHEFYVLIAFGRKTSIRTYFSHGAKKYEKQLLAEVKRQIRLPDWADFDRFMDCPMEGAEYLRLMIARGHVIPPAPSTAPSEG